MSVEKMIKEVIKLGVPLPTYNYEVRQFQVDLMRNEELAEGRRGLEFSEWYDSYSEALMRIIDYYKNG